MQHWTLFVLALFTVSAMLSVGLETGVGEIRIVFGDRALLARALLAVVVAVPLIGFAAIELASLARPVAAGILLMTLAPGATFALQFTRSIGHGGRAAALQLLFVGLSLVFTPLASHWLLPEESVLELRPLRILLVVAGLLLAPLLIGIALRRRAGARSAKLARAAGIVAGASFVLSFWVLLRPVKSQAEASVGTHAVLVMLGIVLASILVGWALGGPDLRARALFTTHASVRNAALALVIADHGFPDPLVRQAVIAYAALMMPPNFILMLLIRYILKHRAIEAGPHPSERAG